jgi:5'(3')-deoxyribonucleotidase
LNDIPTAVDLNTYKEPDNWYFHRELGLTDSEFMQHFVDGVNAGVIFGYGTAYPGTRKAVQDIINLDHSIHIITDRAVGDPGIAFGLTGKWVAKYLPKPIQSITFSRDKTIVPTDMMIDDKLSNYEDLEATDCEPWLLDRPWNQSSDSSIRRVYSLKEFADKVRERSLVPA